MVGVLLVRLVVGRVVEGRAVFCIVRTARARVGGPDQRDGPFPLLDKPSSKVFSNYCGDLWGLELLWSGVSRG